MSEVLKDFASNIDLKETLINDPIKVVEGDNGNILVLSIVKDGKPVDLTDCLVQIVFAHSGRTVWQDSSSPNGGISIGGDDNNVVTVRLHSDSYAPNGITVCQVKIYSGIGQETLVSSARFSFKAELSLLNTETVESIEQYSILVKLIKSVNSVLDGSQSDWNETDQLLKSYIRNKPVIGTDIQDATQNLIDETALADADTVPFYDASTMSHRKSTWSNIVAKIRTALFGSVTGLLKLDGAGNPSAGVANTDFAAALHAARHAAGSPDAVAATAINAAKKSSGFSNYTLAVASWGNPSPGLYTITSANLAILSNVVDANTAVEFQPAVGATTAQIQALQAANVQEYSQSAGTLVLKAHGTVPTIDIPIRINVRGDVY